MQSLNAIEANFQVRCQGNVFEIDRNDFLSFIEREINFSIAVVRFERWFRYVEEHSTCAFQRKLNLSTPVLPRRNAFVVPDVDGLFVYPLNLWIHDFLVLVGIAHKDIGVIALIGGEWSIH